jgi:hypothetical protein
MPVVLTFFKEHVAANGPETLQRFLTWFHKQEKLAGIWFDNRTQMNREGPYVFQR